ncbi:NAD(P)/FAD-dependent oxidoreductase, partial [Parvularcula oceani]|uniref:NAD(P)/FAD-dependent oxidoreductase n=1 Tax=Parvularcula oceani TaxID=1247963 RepID=UPI0004E26338
MSDVLMIGGGVIGLSAALVLARQGAAVTLLADERPGASHAAAGMLSPSCEGIHAGVRALRSLGRESLELWDGFAAGLSADPADELDYDRSGVLAVGFPPRALPGDPAPVPEGIEAPGAVLLPDEGQVDPRRLLRRLAAACLEAGVSCVTGQAGSLICENGRVAGARSVAGDRHLARRTVLATGAASLDPTVSLVPVRGRAFLIDAPPVSLPRVVRSPGVYLCPKAGGRLYVGATEEERPSDVAPAGLWHEACWLMPALRQAEVTATFDGVRPGTEDGLPIIRRSEWAEGLILALGHHRNGVLLAPLTAREVARLVSEEA